MPPEPDPLRSRFINIWSDQGHPLRWAAATPTMAGLRGSLLSRLRHAGHGRGTVSDDRLAVASTYAVAMGLRLTGLGCGILRARALMVAVTIAADTATVTVPATATAVTTATTSVAITRTMTAMLLQQLTTVLALRTGLGRDDPALGALGDAQVSHQLGRGRVRFRDLAERQVEHPVDGLPARDIGPVDKRDGDALLASATGTADAVHVRLLVVGALEVHDVGDVRHVDAAGSDVGGDDDLRPAVSEALQRLLPRDLGEVSVDAQQVSRWTRYCRPLLEPRRAAPRPMTRARLTSPWGVLGPERKIRWGAVIWASTLARNCNCRLFKSFESRVNVFN